MEKRRVDLEDRVYRAWGLLTWCRYLTHREAIEALSALRLGVSLGVDFSLTHSCYDPSPAGEACGACDACRLRLKGFREAGVEDPVRYSSRPER